MSSAYGLSIANCRCCHEPMYANKYGICAKCECNKVVKQCQACHKHYDSFQDEEKNDYYGREFNYCSDCLESVRCFVCSKDEHPSRFLVCDTCPMGDMTISTMTCLTCAGFPNGPPAGTWSCKKCTEDCKWKDIEQMISSRDLTTKALKLVMATSGPVLNADEILKLATKLSSQQESVSTAFDDYDPKWSREAITKCSRRKRSRFEM